MSDGATSSSDTECVVVKCRERFDCPDHEMEKSGVIDETGQEITVCVNCGWTNPAGQDHLLEQSGRYTFRSVVTDTDQTRGDGA